MKKKKLLPNKMGPINVSWHITFECNYDCLFCFRPNFGGECSLDEAKKIIDKLAKAGLKKISWGGGEPLLWKGMYELIEYTHNLGISTMLITNGELLDKTKIKKLEKSLDWLNLPLDGSNEKMQSLMTRKKGHFKRVKNIINFIKKNKINISLKINTVASRINKDDIVNIAKFVKANKIERWKIFQFYPIRMMSIKNKVLYQMKDSDFLRLKEEIMPSFKKTKQMVVFETNEDMERSYFAISSSGKVYVSHKGKDYIIGDLKKDSIEKIWKNDLLDKLKYWERSKWVLRNQ
ncbi:radical SAM protein [Patescibacteria group bacterium]